MLIETGIMVKVQRELELCAMQPDANHIVYTSFIHRITLTTSERASARVAMQTVDTRLISDVLDST